MTYKEALLRAKQGLIVYEKQFPQLTEQIKFQKTVISSLEKQIPTKIVTKGHLEFCPNCNTELTHLDYYYVKTHCCECGQALFWESDTK